MSADRRKKSGKSGTSNRSTVHSVYVEDGFIGVKIAEGINKAVDYKGSNLNELLKSFLQDFDIISTDFKDLADVDALGHMIFHKSLNHADAIKDGTSAHNALLHDLFPDSALELSHLKKLIKKVKMTALKKGHAELVPWHKNKLTNTAKDAAIALPHVDVVWDAGHSPDHLFGNNYTLYDNWGKAVDSSTIGQGAKDSYPPRGETLTISADAFENIGFAGHAACQLYNATRLASDNYSYKMMLTQETILVMLAIA